MKLYTVVGFMLMNTLFFRISEAQDIPLSNYVITDATYLFPSSTGLSGGSIHTGTKYTFVGVEGAPRYYYLGGQSISKKEKIAFGGNLNFQESNVLFTFNPSLYSAYHLPLSGKLRLSFGLGTEYAKLGINKDTYVEESNDQVLLNYQNIQTVDFLSGLGLTHARYQIRVGVNRMRSLISEKHTLLPGQVNAAGTYKVFLNDEYRRIEFTTLMRSNTHSIQYDFMSYYLDPTGLIAGLTYRTKGAINLALGWSFNNRFVFGYNYDFYTGSNFSSLHGSHEITLRYNLNHQYFRQNKFSEKNKAIEIIRPE